MDNYRFEESHWTIRCEGHEFKAIGYEWRGIWGVPVVYFDEQTGDSVCSDVYQVVKGYKVVRECDHIGAEKLNATEIALLESVGCKWTGCWIEKA